MLYLREELTKSKDSKDPDKPTNISGGRGEQRGGKYVARVQIGYEKDGSPKYRYFESEEEYEKYLQGRGRSKAAKELERKVKREHEESKDKHTGSIVHQPASRKLGLLSKDKEKVAKSLRLYVRI